MPLLPGRNHGACEAPPCPRHRRACIGYLVGASGIEPPTPTMSTWCSTTELRACCEEANGTGSDPPPQVATSTPCRHIHTPGDFPPHPELDRMTGISRATPAAPSIRASRSTGRFRAWRKSPVTPRRPGPCATGPLPVGVTPFRVRAVRWWPVGRAWGVLRRLVPVACAGSEQTEHSKADDEQESRDQADRSSNGPELGARRRA